MHFISICECKKIINLSCTKNTPKNIENYTYINEWNISELFIYKALDTLEILGAPDDAKTNK